MHMLFGEYDCKLDEKGRFLFPAALLKQLPEPERADFVLSNGLDDCLYLYPLAVWQEELQRLQRLNQYQEKVREFRRKVMHGATPISLDGSKRVLVSKRLLEMKQLGKELIILGAGDKFEIWDKQRYEARQADDSRDLAELSEEVMGTLSHEDDRVS